MACAPAIASHPIRWVSYAAARFNDTVPCSPCERPFFRQRLLTQSASARLELPVADRGRFPDIGAVPARPFLPSLSRGLQIRPNGRSASTTASTQRLLRRLRAMDRSLKMVGRSTRRRETVTITPSPSGMSFSRAACRRVKTSSGIGHLVLVVATTKGDIVMDNLTEAIRPWQSTDYDWLKIQSAADARLWYGVKTHGPSLSEVDRRVRLADR